MEMPFAEEIFSLWIFPYDRFGATPENTGTFFHSLYSVVVIDIRDERDYGIVADQGFKVQHWIGVHGEKILLNPTWPEAG
jgi:hypothetical protein